MNIIMLITILLASYGLVSIGKDIIKAISKTRRWKKANPQLNPQLIDEYHNDRLFIPLSKKKIPMPTCKLPKTVTRLKKAQYTYDMDEQFIAEAINKKPLSEIITESCPDVYNSGPGIDINTEERNEEGTTTGCRGITCKQCWDMEV